MPRRLSVLLCLFAALGLSGCQTTYYKAMRTLGKEKRDILVSRIKDAKKDQQQASDQIKTTMQSFQELTGFKGGSLEKSYNRLNSEYEKANGQANKLHDRIQSIDQVSQDLFKEWQGEINQMDNRKLKTQSAAMLRDARIRQAAYLRSMHRTEDQMTPVLHAFHDQVLFLKHNLNARAIGSLKNTTASIQDDVTVLLASMDGSMQEADKLIASLNTDNGGNSNK
jgi:predicted  nucleic acid-binding Zn-ribbon protein